MGLTVPKLDDMKKLIILIAVLFTIPALQAQDEGKVRASFDLGGSVPGGGFGLLSNLEVNYNISEDMRAGLRIGSGVFVRDLELNNDNEFVSGDFSANYNFLGTFDYCFNRGNPFVPYVGAGLGIYNIAAYAGRDGENFQASILDYSTKFGGILRGGFELGKFRVGLEYNFMPAVPLINAEGVNIGSDMSNSYLGVTIGFFLGGGWWGRL